MLPSEIKILHILLRVIGRGDWIQNGRLDGVWFLDNIARCGLTCTDKRDFRSSKYRYCYYDCEVDIAEMATAT